jgi:hypothetical protein
MSGSSGGGGDTVRVNIIGDASALTGAADRAAASMDKAATAMARYSRSLNDPTTATYRLKQAVDTLGEGLKGLNNDWLVTGEGSMLTAKALKEAAVAAEGGGGAMKAAGAAAMSFQAGFGAAVPTLAQVTAGFRQASAAAAAAGTTLQAMSPTIKTVSAGLVDASITAQRFWASLTSGERTRFREAILADATATDVLRAEMLRVEAAARGQTVTMGAAMMAVAQARNEAVVTGAEMNKLATAFGATGVSAKDAADSFAVFAQKFDPSLAARMRGLMDDNTDSVDKLRASLMSLADTTETAAQRLDREIGALDAARNRAAAASIDFEKLGYSTTKSAQALIEESAAADSFIKSLDPDQIERFSAALNTNSTSAERMRASMLALQSAERGAAVSAEAILATLIKLRNEAIQSGAEVNRLATDFGKTETAARSAADAFAFFEEQGTRLTQGKLRQYLDGDIPQAAEHSRHGVAMLGHEFIVLGHEAMMGNYSRIPSTLLVLLEYSGSLTSRIVKLASEMTAMGWAGAAALGVVAAGFVTLIMRAHEATAAINEAMNAATMRGRDPQQTAATIRASADAMTEVGLVSRREAVNISAAITTLPEAANGVKDKLQALGSQMFLNWGDKASEELSHIMASTSSLKSYLEQQHLLVGDQASAWANAIDDVAKYRIGVGLLATNLPTLDQVTQQLKEQRAARAAVAADIASGGSGNVPNVDAAGPVMKLGDFQPQKKAEDPQATADNEAVIQLTAHNRELVEITARRDAAVRALTAAEAAHDTAAVKQAQQAVDNGNTMIAMWKAQGDAAWAQKQQAALDQILVKVGANATSIRGREEALNKERVAFWENAAKTIAKTPEQVLMAEERANQARLSLQKESLAGGIAAARQGLQEKLAELSREQEAEKDNYDKVMEIERQKLAVIRAALGERSKLYQDEVKKEEALERAHAAELARVGEQTLQQKRSQDQAEFQIRKDLDDEAVLEGKLSKDKEIADLRAFADAQHAEELRMAQATLATLQEGTAAYTEFYNKIITMTRQWAAEDAKLHREAVAADAARANTYLGPFENAISGQVSALMRGTETMHQAVVKMAGNIVTEYATMAVKAALEWAGLQAWTVAKALWAQAMQTTATAAGTAARTGIQAGGAAAENAGFLMRVARWIASELGLTAATTAGTGTRTTIQAGADAAALSAQGATNVAEGMSYAAVGASAAGASVAAIPVVGWAMAPGVAATTYGELSGFASMAALAVGAWNLPRDMPANLHAGEMVIPQTFAEGMRRGGGIGGGNTTQNLNYSPRFSGGDGGQSASQMRQQSAAFKSYMWHATRNGALNLPHGH